MNRDVEKRKLEWRAAQIELRKNFTNTPAGFQNRDCEEEAKNNLQKDWETYKEKQKNRLSCEYEWNQEIFVGRERELQEITDQIKFKQNVPVILYGIGGSGKSALAHEWVRRNREKYIHVLEVKYQYNLCDTICNDKCLNYAGLTYKKEIHGNKTKYFHIKLNQLEEHMKKYKTLMLLDECDFSKDRNMKYVFSLPCDMIITTRINPRVWGYGDGIHVDSLKEETEWKKLLEAYSQEVSNEARSKLRREKDYCKGNITWMLFALQQEGITSVNTDYQNLEEFEKSLFRHLNLKMKEKNILQCLSLMPDLQMPRSLLVEFTDCTEESLIKLEEYLFLRSYGKSDAKVMIHPVIAEAVKIMLPITCTSCAKMIRRTSSWLQHRMEHYSLEENRYLEEFVLAFVEGFPRKADYLAEEFLRIYNFLELQGYQMERSKLISRKIIIAKENKSNRERT